MRIRFLFSFHNNILAFAKNLSKNHVVIVNSSSTVPEPLVQKFIPLKQCSIFGHTIYWYPLRAIYNVLSSDDDIVILKHLNQPMCLVPAFLLRFKFTTPIVYQQKLSSLGFFRRCLLKTLLPSDAKAISVLPQETYKLNEVLPTKYLPLPINDQRFVSRPTREDKYLRIMMVGKLSQRRKQHLILLAAADQLRQEGIRLQLTLIGQSGNKNWYKKQLQESIKQTSLQVTLKQDVPYQQMCEEYARHDVFVLPATREPVGFSVLEAMASGLPIVCSDEVGAAQYLDGNGFVFPARDASALAKFLQRFVKNGVRNEQAIQQYGKQGQEIIRKNHNPQAVAQEFTQFIEQTRT